MAPGASFLRTLDEKNRNSAGSHDQPKLAAGDPDGRSLLHAERRDGQSLEG